MDNANPYAQALAARLAPNQRSVMDPRQAIAERLMNYKAAPVTGRGEGIAQALAAALSGAGGAYLSNKMRDDQQQEHREGLAALLGSSQQFDQRQRDKEQRDRDEANAFARSLGFGAPTPAPAPPAGPAAPMPEQQPGAQPAAPVSPVAQETLPSPGGDLRATNSQFAQRRADAMSRLQGQELDAELAKVSAQQASVAQGIPQGTQFRANPGIGGVFAGVPAPAPGVPVIPQQGGGQPDLRMAAATTAASGNPLLARMAPMLGQMAGSRERDQDRREDREWRAGEAGRAQSNADRAFALQQEQARLAADREGRAADQAGVPAGYRRSAAGALEFIPGGPADPAQVKSAADARGGGRALPSPERTSLIDAGGRATEIGALRNTFDNDYGGYRAAFIGDAANAMARNTPGAASPRADWWQRYQSQKNVVRNQLFGAALTATEAGEFEKADINPGMAPALIRTNLARQQHIIESALMRRARSLAADNYSKSAIEEATGISLQDAAPEPDRRQPTGGDAPPAHPALPPGFTVVQ